MTSVDPLATRSHRRGQRRRSVAQLSRIDLRVIGGGAELAHERRGVDAVAGHVADHQRGPIEALAAAGWRHPAPSPISVSWRPVRPSWQALLRIRWPM